MSQSRCLRSKVTCFICGAPAVVTNEAGRNPSSGEGDASVERDPLAPFDDSERQRQKLVLEHSVFVIKSLFQVPDLIFLENENTSLVNRDGKLQMLGFCHSCSESVEKARTIYGDLLKAVQIFRNIQHRLVEKVKGQGRSAKYEGDPALETWWQFISNHPYGHSNAFLLEDCSHIVKNLLTALQANSSSFARHLPQVIVIVKEQDVNGTDSVKYLEPDDHHDSNDSVEMKAQSDDSLVDEEEEEEKPIKSNNDEFELMEEVDDFEGYSSEEEKALPSDLNLIEDEADLKVETDPLQLNSEEESSTMSSGIGNIVSTRTLRSRKRVRQDGEPSDDPHQLSSEDNSNTGSPMKQKKLRDPKPKFPKQKRSTKTTKPAPFPCPKSGCLYAYFKKKILLNHLERDHNEKQFQFKCWACDESFLLENQMTTHISTQHPHSFFSCQQCPKYFNKEVNLKLHITQAHTKSKKKPATSEQKCTVDGCDKIFQTASGLGVHLAVTHKIPKSKSYKCPEENCGKVYTNADNLKIHIYKDHKNEPLYKCESCDASFFTRPQLGKHRDRVHLQDPSFVCNICNKNYSAGHDLWCHRRINHGVNEGTSAERISELAEAFKDNVKVPRVPRAHRDKGASKSDDGDSSGICEICGKTYENKLSRYRHYRYVHKKELVCELCGKCFPVNSRLRHHLYVEHKVGTEEDRLVFREADRRCEVVGCRKRFWGKKADENFKRHMEEVHGGEDGTKMKFECEQCGKGFGRKNSFEEHRLMHLNKDSKPFKCEMCGKGFATWGYLRYHQLNTHKAPRMFRRKKETKPRDRKPVKKKE